MAVPDAYDQIFHEIAREMPLRFRQAGIPGAAMVIVDGEGTLWEARHGVRDRTQNAPVTPDTLFGLQSCSKTFTATAVLLAVQEGLLDLDRPMDEYLPDFTLQSRHETHPERRITLRHLLAHRAGLTHEAPLGNNYTAASERVGFDEHIHSIRRTWLRYPVGQRFAYSNLGIDLAGYILQQVGGLPFAEYVRRKLFVPLAMTRSTFDIEGLSAFSDRARGHDPFVDAAGVPLPECVPMIPSGAMYASAGDVARYLRFLLNQGRVDGRRVLGEELLREMITVSSAGEGQFEGYGLGVAIRRIRGMSLVHHSGGGYGFLSDMLCCPDRGLGIVFLTNSSAHNLQWSLPYGLLEHLLGPGLKPHRVGVSGPILGGSDKADHASLVGQYVGRLPDCWEVRQKGGRLVLCRPGGKDVRTLQFHRPNEAYTETPLRLSHWRFAVDEQGRPDHLEHVDSGTRYDFNGGPGDPQDQERAAWRVVTGTYGAFLLGGVPWMASVRWRGGHLCLSMGPPMRRTALRLEPFRPGLFFTSTGEAVDFTDETPRFGGVPVRRIGRVKEIRQWGVLLRGVLRSWRDRRVDQRRPVDRV